MNSLQRFVFALQSRNLEQSSKQRKNPNCLHLNHQPHCKLDRKAEAQSNLKVLLFKDIPFSNVHDNCNYFLAPSHNFISIFYMLCFSVAVVTVSSVSWNKATENRLLKELSDHITLNCFGNWYVCRLCSSAARACSGKLSHEERLTLGVFLKI